MTKDKALKLALEALETLGEEEWVSDDDYGMMQVYDADKVNEALTAIKEALAQDEQEQDCKDGSCDCCWNEEAQPEQERDHVTDGSPCWCEPDIEYYGLEPWEHSKKSATHGMNLGQRITHVGGQTTDTGRVEFGSLMAVKALVDHVLRDTTPPKREWVGLTDEDISSVLSNLQVMYNRPPTTDSRAVFARAIEAKLKEKNT